MKPILPSTGPHSRLERELERERNQRLKNDDEKSGIGTEDEFRTKDARDNLSSGLLHRPRSR
jgi:hypothetical protein